ncbi:MAG: hypothetical protein BRD23_05535 [Halobacteriales archaeon SW_9_67_25]|nr:MAG: hypothetical protein BRD23_05535 [Halobacteriales archaeon SW_9_67_25]
MRAQTAIVAVALLVAVAAVPVVGMAATDGTVLADQHENSTEDGAETDAAGDANASVAPGERLSGVVGVQEAELDGEVEGRAFGIKVAQAATNESRADVVADQLRDVEQRLNETEQRRRELEKARENGSISEGKYRAEMAKLAAQTQTAKELTNRSENASEGMPAELLESKGINASAIQTLKDRAEQLTGPEVAEIARSIAGNASPVGAGPSDRGPGDGGPPEDRGPGDGGLPEDRGPGDGDEEDTDGEETPTPDDSDGDDADGADDESDRGNAGDGGDGGY